MIPPENIYTYLCSVSTINDLNCEIIIGLQRHIVKYFWPDFPIGFVTKHV